MAKRKYTKLTDEKITKIHQLLEYGLSQAQVAKTIGTSGATVSRVCSSGVKNLEEWKAWNKRMNSKAEPAKEEATEVNPLKGKTLFYTPEEQSSLELTRIANALERLADAWESTPSTIKKRKSFF